MIYMYKWFGLVRSQGALDVVLKRLSEFRETGKTAGKGCQCDDLSDFDVRSGNWNLGGTVTFEHQM